MPIKFDRLQTIVLYRNFPPDNTTACIKQDKINSTNQVNLKKNFGFSIVGGSNSPIGDIGIFVKTVSPGGLAATSNLLKQGDEIVAVNGKSLHGLTHAEAIKVLKKCGRYSLILTLSHKIQNQALISCIDDEFHSSQIQISENVQQPTFKLNSTTMKKVMNF
uniref:PDZ domain-containing protein n=1 Tax=Rhabditophanes sp. KR3021 TaxID=114890 RepID=A0AC35TIL5_9BILA